MAHNATTLPVETAVIWSDDEEAPDAVVAARAAAAAQRAEARRRAAATPEAAWRLQQDHACLLYTSPSPRDPKTSRMPSSA